MKKTKKTDKQIIKELREQARELFKEKDSYLDEVVRRGREIEEMKGMGERAKDAERREQVLHVRLSYMAGQLEVLKRISKLYDEPETSDCPF